MMSLSKPQFLYIAWQDKLTKASLFEVLTPPLQQTADNKQPMLPVPTSHCTLPFCIELCTCSVELLGSVVFEAFEAAESDNAAE